MSRDAHTLEGEARLDYHGRWSHACAPARCIARGLNLFSSSARLSPTALSRSAVNTRDAWRKYGWTIRRVVRINTTSSLSTRALRHTTTRSIFSAPTSTLRVSEQEKLTWPRDLFQSGKPPLLVRSCPPILVKPHSKRRQISNKRLFIHFMNSFFVPLLKIFIVLSRYLYQRARSATLIRGSRDIPRSEG